MTASLVCSEREVLTVALVAERKVVTFFTLVSAGLPSMSAGIHFPIIFSLRLRSGVVGLSSLLLHEAAARLMPQTVAAISR